MEQYHIPTNPLEEDPVARAVAALPVPEPPKGEKLQEKAGKSHDLHTPELTVRETGSHTRLVIYPALANYLMNWT